MTDLLFWTVSLLGTVATIFTGFMLRKIKFGYILIPPVVVGVIASILAITTKNTSFVDVFGSNNIIILFYTISCFSLIFNWIRFYLDVKKYYTIWS